MTGVQPAVVPIGIFDGVHRGHQLVLAHAVAAAKERDARVVVITFDPHPVAVLRPEAMPLMLTTLERRIQLLEQHGADQVVVLEFTEALSHQSAEEFVEQTLIERLHAVQIVVGQNFRFGHRASGDVALLRKYDLAVDDVALLRDTDVISSTYVREKVAAGDVAAAAVALGRNHFVEGAVVRGDARGRELGFPTANLGIDHRIAIPHDGVYAGWLTRADDSRHLAAISVGTNPTFNGVARRVEAYVIDEGHELDLYDEHVVVEFAQQLRGMERFDAIEDLVDQMHRDVDQARALLTP
ncbi:MAG: bifunctional riboflavin kinase/FAD synthetase [Frankiaceae bacterium]|nr:bifunctional riboflavin kinase/FAD synthetase [Frankiaceae bacterium]MBV9870602.1 bifunctional riboflavin kinase/FAD synthetase [Frankiaceae bacterium]